MHKAQISKATKEGQDVIVLRLLGYDAPFLQELKKIVGWRYFSTERVWQFPYAPSVWKQLKATLDDGGYVFTVLQGADNQGVVAKAQPDRTAQVIEADNNKRPKPNAGVEKDVNKNSSSENVIVWKNEGYPSYYYLRVPFAWKARIKGIGGFWDQEQKVWRLACNPGKKRALGRVTY
jgi:hypothetical protein